MELDAEAGESKIDRAIGRHSERRTPGEITREEIRPTTVSQVFQNEKVVPTWPECRCSTLKLRRRRRGRQNHNLIVDIQAIELRRFWARPQGMHIEIVSQATPGENLLNTFVLADMATAQNRPRRVIVQQQSR